MVKTVRKISQQKVNRKRQSRKFKKKKKYHLKNLNYEFIGNTLIRMHSEHTRPMSARTKSAAQKV